jgi:hypothetical protein
MAAAAGLAELTQHRWMVIAGRIVDAGTLVHSDVPRVRELERAGAVLCPTCREPVQVVMGDSGAYVEHLPGSVFGEHEPEDPVMRSSKRLLASHLHSLFGSATVAVDGRIDEIGRMADVVMVTGEGGRLAIEVQAQDMPARDVAAAQDAYAELGILSLWLLDSRRLVIGRPRRGLDKRIRKVRLDRLETGLLAAGVQLLYLDPRRREVVFVRPPAAAVELARLGDPRLGRLDCLVLTFKLNQLRMRGGRFSLDMSYVSRMPAAPQLPPALQRRLARRRQVTS